MDNGQLVMATNVMPLMMVAWEKLFAGTTGMHLNCAPEALEYMPNILLRGLEGLPVIFEK